MISVWRTERARRFAGQLCAVRRHDYAAKTTGRIHIGKAGFDPWETDPAYPWSWRGVAGRPRPGKVPQTQFNKSEGRCGNHRWIAATLSERHYVGLSTMLVHITPVGVLLGEAVTDIPTPSRITDSPSIGHKPTKYLRGCGLVDETGWLLHVRILSSDESAPL